MPEFIIDDDAPVQARDSANHAKGLVERDYSKHPVGSYGSAPEWDMELIPRSEWVERIKDQMANRSSLVDIRRTRGPNGSPIPSLDQNGQGFCWCYSTTMCTMMLRAAMNQPYVRLSGHMPACLIKNYQDEGGWGALSLDFIVKNGIATVADWKEKSMSRSNDTPEMRKNALLYRVTESWADLQQAAYDRNMTEDQTITCLLLNQPVVGDFNWWGHSVCLLAAVLGNAARGNTFAFPDFGSMDLNDPKQAKVFGDIINKKGINSWTDNWGDLGEFTLSGNKAHLDGGVSPRVATASTPLAM